MITNNNQTEVITSKNAEQAEEVISPIQDIKDTIGYLINPKMLHVTPLILWTAISVSVYSGVLIILMTRSMSSGTKHGDLHDVGKSGDQDFVDNNNKREKAALLAMIMLGFGEIVGGLIVGKVRDTIGNKPCIFFQILLVAASLFMILRFNNSNDFDYFPAYMMCFLWGTQDSGTNCFINCILGFEFDSKILPFSVFKFTQSLFIFVFQLVQSKVLDTDAIPDIDDQVNTLQTYLIAVGAFGILSLLIMIPFKFKETGEEETGKVKIDKGESETLM